MVQILLLIALDYSVDQIVRLYVAGQIAEKVIDTCCCEAGWARVAVGKMARWLPGGLQLTCGIMFLVREAELQA
jgi:hypothetical protein